MAWQRDSRVQAGVHSVLRRSRQISPVFDVHMEMSMGDHTGSKKKRTHLEVDIGMADGSHKGDSRWGEGIGLRNGHGELKDTPLKGRVLRAAEDTRPLVQGLSLWRQTENGTLGCVPGRALSPLSQESLV